MLQLVTLWCPHLGTSAHSTACGVRLCGFHPTPRPWQCYPTLHRAQNDLLRVSSKGAHLAGTKKAPCHKHTQNWVTPVGRCRGAIAVLSACASSKHIAKTFAVPTGESPLTLVFVSCAGSVRLLITLITLPPALPAHSTSCLCILDGEEAAEYAEDAEEIL
jgi:hypothetical protein